VRDDQPVVVEHASSSEYLLDAARLSAGFDAALGGLFTPGENFRKMQRVKDILRSSYDRSAPAYDAEFRPLQRPKYEALLAGALPRSGDRRPALDLGCGTGLLAEWLAERGLSLEGPLVGLDLSAQMLLRARPRGVRAVQGDLERLPFRDAGFGAVFAFTALAIGGGPAAALSESARVLAPDGLFAVSVLKNTWTRGFEHELRAAGLSPGLRRDCGQDWGYVCSRRR
jgi:ubiquinone/menaquinone biosynthesis C-methylase UbiE